MQGINFKYNTMYIVQYIIAIEARIKSQGWVFLLYNISTPTLLNHLNGMRDDEFLGIHSRKNLIYILA